jgi:GAF domain-containing protein
MRLASLAQVTSAEAATGPDQPEVIARLEAAMRIVDAEFASTTSEPPARTPRTSSAPPSAQSQLRAYLQTHLELMTQRGLFMRDVSSTIRRVNEAAAHTLGVERVSVWFLNGDQSAIECADLFERTKAKHSAGIALKATDFPSYFQALSRERTIAADDAHTDPRTSSFTEPYLKPLGITSMLDVPIWSARRMVGVVCHEHVGPKRHWHGDEETFAYLMSSYVALALERSSDRG